MVAAFKNRMSSGKNIIGTRLSEARKSKELTQLDLSRKVSALTPIDRSGIAKIETGLRCVYDYCNICRSYCELLGFTVTYSPDHTGSERLFCSRVYQ